LAGRRIAPRPRRLLPGDRARPRQFRESVGPNGSGKKHAAWASSSSSTPPTSCTRDDSNGRQRRTLFPGAAHRRASPTSARSVSSSTAPCTRQFGIRAALRPHAVHGDARARAWDRRLRGSLRRERCPHGVPKFTCRRTAPPLFGERQTPSTIPAAAAPCCRRTAAALRAASRPLPRLLFQTRRPGARHLAGRLKGRVHGADRVHRRACPLPDGRPRRSNLGAAAGRATVPSRSRGRDLRARAERIILAPRHHGYATARRAPGAARLHAGRRTLHPGPPMVPRHRVGLCTKRFSGHRRRDHDLDPYLQSAASHTTGLLVQLVPDPAPWRAMRSRTRGSVRRRCGETRPAQAATIGRPLLPRAPPTRPGAPSNETQQFRPAAICGVPLARVCFSRISARPPPRRRAEARLRSPCPWPDSPGRATSSSNRIDPLGGRPGKASPDDLVRVLNLAVPRPTIPVRSCKTDSACASPTRRPFLTASTGRARRVGVARRAQRTGAPRRVVVEERLSDDDSAGLTPDAGRLLRVAVARARTGFGRGIAKERRPRPPGSGRGSNDRFGAAAPE